MSRDVVIRLADERVGITVELLYGAVPEIDIITRAAIIKNEGTGVVTVDRAQTACLDFVHGEYDVISFYGRHAMERTLPLATMLAMEPSRWEAVAACLPTSTAR